MANLEIFVVLWIWRMEWRQTILKDLLNFLNNIYAKMKYAGRLLIFAIALKIIEFMAWYYKYDILCFRNKNLTVSKIASRIQLSLSLSAEFWPICKFHRLRAYRGGGTSSRYKNSLKMFVTGLFLSNTLCTVLLKPFKNKFLEFFKSFLLKE